MKKTLIIFSCLVSFSLTVLSQDCIWLGTVDSLWQNPLNWSCNKIPDSTNNVYVFGGTPFSPVVDQDVTCKDLYIADSIFKYLNEAYSCLAGDQGYGKVFSLYYTVDNDEIMFSPGMAGDNGRRSLARYDINPTNNELQRPFYQLYFGIERANICIKYFSLMVTWNLGSDSVQAKNKRMYGEALTLRGQLYFELIRNWGDVPFSDSTSFVKNSNGFLSLIPDLQNTDRDTTYRKILNDLLLAETYLPWRTELPLTGDSIDERITKGAAKALRAKVALFAGGYSLRKDSIMKRPADFLNFYDTAKQECLGLMNNRNEHTLNPDYKAIWKNTVCAHKVDDGYGEIIFQVKSRGNNTSSGSKLGYYNGPRVNSFGNASLALLPTYFYLFDSIDTRRDVVAAPYEVIADSITKRGLRLHEIRDGKFRRDWISDPSISPTDLSQYFGLNWPLIRFADVLLMFAEADNEINNGATPAAIAAFEEVRRRGYGSNANLIGPTPADKAGFFDALVKERALELGGEGIRKYDLIRWNLLEAKILETRDNINKMAAGQSPYSTLPLYMYYNTGTTADNGAIWYNSLYHDGPVTSMVIPGATRVGWISSTISSDPLMAPLITGTLASFAISFTANKCELFPYPQSLMLSNPGMAQNPGY